MKVPSLPKSYRMSLVEAVALQRELAGRVRIEPLQRTTKIVAGVDVSSEWRGQTLFAGVVLFSYPELALVEEAFAEHKAEFPYIPGFLSFREIPALFKAFKKLLNRPDLLMVDGQGIAHPRRLGIASHLGALLDIPSIGVAKSRLYGTFDEPKSAGDYCVVRDPRDDERLGVAYKSKARSNPIIISPGHGITIDESLPLVREMLQGRRLPLPTRYAHEAVNRFRKESKN